MNPFKIALATLLLFASCTAQEENITTDPQPGPILEAGLSYLALGDSYTIGQSVTQEQRWPVLLVKEIRNSGRQIQSPDIIATTGWTTANLLNALNGKPIIKKYDLVSLLIGVNNQYQGRSLEEYRLEFRELLQKSISYSSGGSSKVFVLSTPDWGVTPYGSGSDMDRIAREIDQFNAVAREECERRSVSFIDITPTSRLAFNDPSMVASDRLHFSGKMHQLWVEQALPFVKQKL